jgi:hypothetical protein
MCLTKRKLDTNSSTPGSIKKKQRIRKAKYACKYPGCNRKCRSPGELQNHTDAHNGKYKNVCDYVDENGIKCTYQCVEVGRMNYHKKRHNIEEQHKCEHAGCNRSFVAPCRLREHIDFIHLLVYNFVCGCFNANGDKCEDKFETASQLSRHKKLQHSDKPPQFKCADCNKTFKLAENHKKHLLRFHTSPTDPKRIAFYAKLNAAQRQRYANDDHFRVKVLLQAGLLYMRVKAGLGKNATTDKTIGCNPIQFIAHLNNNDRGLVFGDDDTFGRLEIDHIRPVHDMKKGCRLDFLRISRFENLRLLPWRENRAKSDTFTSADAARYAEKEGKEIAKLEPGWVAAGVCKCVLCV